MAKEAAAQVQLDNFGSIFSLEGKVAVVTGGSRGLGLHVASGFLQAGCSKVYISSRKASACDEAVAALNALPNKRPGAQAISVAADGSKISELDRLVAEVKKTTDHVDILFANAGATWGAPFDEYPEQSFSKVMDLNAKGVFYTVQKFTPLLEAKATVEDPSRVIITASVAGIGIGTTGKNGTYAYSASKAAAISLSKTLAVELGPRHILTNAVAPGFYPSKMANGLIEMQGGAQALANQSPNGRVGHPEDIAGLVVFLSSRAAIHINGAIIPSDGGRLLAGGKL
ncbi:oxidoreductase [Talaromyces proteolyticus]|uniref:Oxidoreductase n=1 Tax=Talaromyces proteolyticus TaxID=1131652 RepID=A0AAD4KYM3_9EURO|nr:oxidoreductase [Talaromyces proteolyticus]KAH8698931.1 oxidoreductase [Talaromyces proteolyticus]